MDEEEIDTWYEEQKDKLAEEYRKKIDKTKNKEKLKQKFNRDITSLHKKYEKLSHNNIKFNLDRFFFNYRFEKFKKRLLSPIIKLKEESNLKKKREKEK